MRGIALVYFALLLPALNAQQSTIKGLTPIDPSECGDSHVFCTGPSTYNVCILFMDQYYAIDFAYECPSGFFCNPDNNRPCIEMRPSIPSSTPFPIVEETTTIKPTTTTIKPTITTINPTTTTIKPTISTEKPTTTDNEASVVTSSDVTASRGPTTTTPPSERKPKKPVATAGDCRDFTKRLPAATCREYYTCTGVLWWSLKLHSCPPGRLINFAQNDCVAPELSDC